MSAVNRVCRPGLTIVSAFALHPVSQLQNWESSWTEPLTDYVAFGSIIKKLLAYRHQKNVQFEMTVDQIESKKISLEQLERSEDEARRLEGALAAAGVGGGTTPPTAAGSAGGSSAAGGGRGGRTGGGARSGAGSSGGSGGYGFLSALSHSITGMIDVDPEATRRNNISKTRESISQVSRAFGTNALPRRGRRLPLVGHGWLTCFSPLIWSVVQLEDALHLSAQDLKYASQTIQADLDRFQRQKVADVRNMSIALATAHRDWCKQVSLSFNRFGDALPRRTHAEIFLLLASRIWKPGRKLAKPSTPSVSLVRSRPLYPFLNAG